MGGLRGVMITQTVDAADPVLGFTVGWVNALASRLERLDVICLARGEAKLEPNVRVEALPSGRFARYRRVRALLRRLRREGALDFVLAHMCPSYAVAATLPTRLAPTFLWYAHSSVTRMLRLAEHGCDRVFSCSAASFPLPSRTLVVVGHGIDTQHFTPSNEPGDTARFRMSVVGRIAPVKQIEGVLAALELYRAERPETPITCRIIGPTCSPADEAYLEQLRRERDDRGLENTVEFEPPVGYSDVRSVYASSDLLMNTTGRRAVDKVVFEAMACGCLVLTTGRAFTSLLGTHAARMVWPGASPETLAHALEEFVALSVERRAELGRELRQIVVAQHSLKRLMDRIVEEIRTVRAARERR